MLQEIKTLVQTLNEQRDAYYNNVSDFMSCHQIAHIS